jgi:hypothetical protein
MIKFYATKNTAYYCEPHTCEDHKCMKGKNDILTCWHYFEQHIWFENTLNCLIRLFGKCESEMWINA